MQWEGREFRFLLYWGKKKPKKISGSDTGDYLTDPSQKTTEGEGSIINNYVQTKVVTGLSKPG